MKKRLLALFMSLCLVVGLLPTMAWAADEGTKESPWNISAEGEGNDVKAYLLQNNEDAEYPTYTLDIFGTGDMTEFSLTGANANSPWWQFKDQITSVVVEEGVTNLGFVAFYQHTNLTDVTLPDSLTKIAASVFGETKLTSFVVGKNVGSIGNNLFNEVDLERITVAEGNTTFVTDGNALYEKIHDDSTSSDSLKLRYSVRTNTGIYTIPSEIDGLAVTEIAGSSFNSAQWEKVVIPSSVTKVDGFGASKINAVKFDAGETELNIQQYAFWNSPDLTSIEFGTRPTIIGISAFGKCGITTLDIPNSVKIINSTAFMSCPNLTTVAVNAIAVRANAFSSCDQLQTVFVGADTTDFGDSSSGTPVPSCKNLAAIIFDKSFEIPVTNYHCVINNLNSGRRDIMTVAYIKPIVAKSESNNSLLRDAGISDPGNRSVYAFLNGGTFDENASFAIGQLTTPVKAGYKFVNWYTDADCTTQATTIEAGNTYYAKWQDRALTGVTVDPKADAKFAYGDALTAADFVVTEVYDNGETEIVSPENYTVSPEKLETVGSMDVTVTYKGEEYPCIINVEKATQTAPAAPELADHTLTPASPWRPLRALSTAATMASGRPPRSSPT